MEIVLPLDLRKLNGECAEVFTEIHLHGVLDLHFMGQNIILG